MPFQRFSRSDIAALLSSGEFRLACFKMKNKQHSYGSLIFALNKIAYHNLARGQVYATYEITWPFWWLTSNYITRNGINSELMSFFKKFI